MDGRPVADDPLRLWRQRPLVAQTMFLRRIYVADDGRMYAEVYDESGNVWREAPIMVLGGAPDTYLTMTPPSPDIATASGNRATEPGARQVYVLSRGHQSPVVVGAVQHPKQTNWTPNTPTVSQTDDHPGAHAPGDFAVVVGEAHIIVDRNGAVTIASGGDDGNVRIQLPSSGVLRLSRNESATERFPLAGPLADYLDQLASQINSLGSALQALTLKLEAAVSKVVPAVEPYSHTSQNPVVRPTLQSATVHVSNDSEVV